MARINIEECWWSDPRRDKLGKIIGNPDLTESVMVRAWRLAQEYWGKGELIPGSHFLATLHSDALLFSGLARVHSGAKPNSDIVLLPSSLRFLDRFSNETPNGRSNIPERLSTDIERFLTEVEQSYIYVNGSSEAFKWHQNLKQQRVEAGKKSAEKRRLKDGTAQPRRKLSNETPNGRSELVELRSDVVYDRARSVSVSVSDSGSGSVTGSKSGSGLKRNNAAIRIDYPESFDQVWVSYDRKGEKKAAYENWKSLALSADEGMDLDTAIKNYVKFNPDRKFRKDLERFLKTDWRVWINPPAETQRNLQTISNGRLSRSEERRKNNEEVLARFLTQSKEGGSNAN